MYSILKKLRSKKILNKKKMITFKNILVSIAKMF